MTKLLCEHQWTQVAESVDVDGIPHSLKLCGRCNVIWEEGTPEPKVVIGKLVEE